ncbi:uncharacterized protein [Rutidosis leptorrhynchoides]|uniref:uncharacterized protein n=1 Tax=Rutidosis leptorrhynchoides TaxID=125765 RepID=UPI003A9A056A
MDFMANNVGEYIMFGDWNAVRVASERSGTEFCALDATNFNDFINGNMLYEIALGGLQYTWRVKAGNKLSKLDRFFVTNNVLLSCDYLKGVVLPRGCSDHSPIMLFQDNFDYGPTYFKIFHSWFERPKFDDMVQQEWADISLSGPHHITVKLRALKMKLREWITQSRKEEKAQLTELVGNINELDCLIDSGLASNNQIDE